METNAMKLQALSFSADVNAGGDLEQASVSTLLCDFTWSATVWLSCCGS